MSKTILISALLIACLVLLTGCHFSASAGLGKTRTGATTTPAAPTHPSPVQPPPPPVRGDWSEPVNGIRMMAKLVEPANLGPGNTRTLLIFTTNASDRPVHLLPIQTEWLVHRQFNGSEPMEMPDTANNFRIVAEDMNKQRAVHVHPDQYEELMSVQNLEEALEPGEVRVHVIYLMLDIRLLDAMQQLRERDTIQSSALSWTTHVGEPGAYRLHLTYRPDGFYENATDRVEEIKSYQGWTDKQIALPPITVELFEDDFRDPPIAEERNDF